MVLQYTVFCDRFCVFVVTKEISDPKTFLNEKGSESRPESTRGVTGDRVGVRRFQFRFVSTNGSEIGDIDGPTTIICRVPFGIT